MSFRDYRLEHDSMGPVPVPKDKFWGAQTQRSLGNFNIGKETMPSLLISALFFIKLCCARANNELLPEKMTKEKLQLIEKAFENRDKLIETEFPLKVWQTGSGTQTNMNVNEVIANYASSLSDTVKLHPNDDINMSQSSNDVFPSAIHIMCRIYMKTVIAYTNETIRQLKVLEKKFKGIVKSGRTHLQDATPIEFSQEISGWRASLEADVKNIELALERVKRLAIGGTAVGTGLNAPKDFDKVVCKHLNLLLEEEYEPAENKFQALSSKGEVVFAHGAIKALACDLMKIANDVRWLASGPRCGLSEITIPSNEPGSSIMPGKVNPTQCEAVTMIATQVMGNDATIGICASQGNFELNVFMPVIAYNFSQSCELLMSVISSFTKKCIMGIKVNEKKMKKNLHNSLMLVTALTPYIGYEKCAEIAKLAHAEGLSLKEATLKLGYMTEEEFDMRFRPEEMI